MRNEEENVLKCLNSIKNQKYKNLEVLVYDDESTDKTLKILRDYTDFKIRILETRPKPKSWLGKNWACWNLANSATGKYIIFLDADVTLDTMAVSSAIYQMIKDKVSLLSIFPNQITNTISEKLSVPTYLLFLFTFLPINFVKKIRNPSFSASNGQFMLWKKDEYFQIGGHKAIFDKIVEDVELCKLAKRSALGASVYFGSSLVFCRMYTGLVSSFLGISKIYRKIIDINPIIYLVFTLFLGILFISKYILMFFYNEYLLLVIFDFLSISLMYAKIGFRNILFLILIPIHKGILILMMLYSLYIHSKKRVIWKGRRIY